MGLSFEHARLAGARATEKQILEWLGSSTPQKLDIDKCNFF